MTYIEVSKRNYHLLSNMIQWCRENVGPGGYIANDDNSRWSITTGFGESVFAFVDAQDAVFFKLRWA